MKRIFLTSGLVLCMACPALATNVTGQGNECVVGTIGVSDPGSTANLQAQWHPNKSTITFDNGSSYTQTECGANNQIVTHNNATPSNPAGLTTIYGIGVYNTADSVTSSNYSTKTPVSSFTTPVLTGYNFAGYYTNDATPVQKISNNGTLDANLDTWLGASLDDDSGVLYAHWTPKTYTVTYSCGAGSQKSGFTSTTTTTYDDCYTLLSDTAQCEYTGRTFDHWECHKTGDDSTAWTYVASGTWTTDHDVTCTAIWTNNTINLTWDKNGADSEDISNTQCTYGGGIVLPTEPTKVGYTFDGWEVQ